MPGVTQDFGDGYDDQDGAEAFDETNLDEHEEINEMRTFEELPDVLDVTSAEGDRDDDEALALDADEFDEDVFDDDDLEEDNELEYRAVAEEDDEDDVRAGFEDRTDPDSIDGLDEIADADQVSGGEDDFTNFQSKGVGDEDLARMGYARATPEAVEDNRDRRTEASLDEALEETFPASDPVSIVQPKT
jgi:hypothetical protein